MTRKELYYFIGSCLCLDDKPEKRYLIVEKLVKDGMNWEQFVQLGSNHLILQVIYLKFKSHDLLRYLPPDLAEHLENIYKLNYSRNIRILTQVEEITSAMNEAGIYPVFLKGTANLLDNVYSDIGERIIGDIDLLVSQDDYLKAAEIIEGIGYIRDKWLEYILISTSKHFPRLWRKDVPADLEIHRLPVSDQYLRWLNPKMIFKDKVAVLKNGGAYIPSDKHRIMHSFIHSQLEHSQYYFGITSFRDLYDLHLFSKRAEIASLFKDLPSRRKAIAYFTLIERILDLPGKFCQEKTVTSKLYVLRHDLNLSSYGYYKTDHFIRKLFQLFYKSYIVKFFRFFISKSTRQEILGRLKDPKWYRMHFMRYASLLK